MRTLSVIANGRRAECDKQLARLQEVLDTKKVDMVKPGEDSNAEPLVETEGAVGEDVIEDEPDTQYTAGFVQCKVCTMSQR